MEYIQETRKKSVGMSVCVSFSLLLYESIQYRFKLQDRRIKIPNMMDEKIKGTYPAKPLSNILDYPVPMELFHSNYYHLVHKTKDKKHSCESIMFISAKRLKV